ncbi:hypothetical protein P7K49_029482 [Saguinus oedipus]|uniref:Uncharacterized protein n=1 Tax=Saguinus oedipus TaxID=9490 RepID=A0ABQ9U7C2_SAGOE|nr:hypothetical protein P7K49_029482 [Saguinus oedipus]
MPGPRNPFSTTDSAQSPIHSRRLSRHRFRTTDSSWRNPSRALAAGLTHPRRSISTWTHSGPRPTMRRKVPRIAMLPRSPSSAKIFLAVAKDVPSSRPDKSLLWTPRQEGLPWGLAPPRGECVKARVAVTRRQRRKGSQVRGRRKQAQRWAARIPLPHAPRHPPRRRQGTCQSIDELERRLDGVERGESLLVGASEAAASIASARIPYLVVFRLPAS